MQAVQGLFGGGSSKELKALQRAQAAQIEAQRKRDAELTAKESALRRLFSGGAGVSLASNPYGLATSLGG